MKTFLHRASVVTFTIVFFFGTSLPGFPGAGTALAVTNVIYLITPTGSNQTWNVPADWNNADNTIEVIGAGGGGSAATASHIGAGGGGGAYSKITNLTLTPSGTATFRVGTGGTAGAGDGGNGGDTWFNGTTLAGSSAGAKGGGGATANTRGIGGALGSGVGSTKYSGGDGGVEADVAEGATGGGGAAGPGGTGGAGGTSGGSGIVGGSGGGGNGGGGAGVNATTDSNGTAGGTSADSTAGGGGGAGGSPPSSGSGGSHGSGGGGGGGALLINGLAGGSGANGGFGLEWDATHGSGGGGGGGGGNASSTNDSGAGGNGALYGGGGGGSAYNDNVGSGGTFGAGGTGAQGIIVITYTTAGGSGTLTCKIRSGSCSGGEIEIYEMQGIANSHAGLSSASYSNFVCCSGVGGLGTNCSGTFATVLKLSGFTNAHVRQGTLSDYSGANNVCLSVPSGGSVSVGYQATNCAGWDTSLGAMIGTTNSHVGSSSWSAGTTKICATAIGAGTLTADIVDAGGTPVSSPSIVIGAVPFSLLYQTGTGTFGATAQKVRVTNTTLNPQWTLAIAAAGGPTSLLSAGTPKYDYNDPTASASDGGDADAYGGQMTLNPIAGSLAGTCSGTGISKGSSAAFSQSVVDSITLLTAGSGADTNCYWDLIDVGVSQTIPAEQTASGSYSINMTVTVASY